MKVASGRVLDRLPAEEPCLGAVFASYSFDPAFFEDHTIRAVLRLTSDPVEQAVRYHGEARRALQETPVVVIVDAGQRRPGHRLPYDLLEVSDIVFHPKSVLLLYREWARLMVGSGNLTSSGYGGNTELFLSLDLAYNDPADADLLHAFDEHLDRVGKLSRQRGSQLQLFREELSRRIGAGNAPAPSSKVALLDSTKSPIIEQLMALLPDDAIVESVGMLAPSYERDDAGDLDDTSVFGALAAHTAKEAVLDVGVAWDNSPVQADTELTALENGLGRLWGWSYEADGAGEVEYLVPMSVGRSALGYTDQRGNRRRRPVDEALADVERRTFWMLPQPITFAPRHAIQAARAQFAEVRLWLHPATRMVDGHPVHRPLHAKLLLIGFRSGRSRGTLVLVGSANMSRRALLLRAGPNLGNVELGLAFRLEGNLTLADFAPELVFAPPSGIELQEREFPELGHNYALAIDSAVHDPIERTLTVTWSKYAEGMPAWRLSYDGTELAQSSIAPSVPVVKVDFVLQPSSAEVILHVEGREYATPILVTDLVALPAAPAGPGLGLDELLMLLGRRIGAERAVQIAQRQATGGDDNDALAAFFGEGFGPTDVFRAWWSVAKDLQDPEMSVLAFRLRLEGSLGAGAAWSRMLEAMKNERQLQPAEVWFYGAELLRTLAEIALPPGLDRDAKNQVLAAFRKRVQADLAAIQLDTGSRPWVQRIRDFYKETRT